MVRKYLSLFVITVIVFTGMIPLTKLSGSKCVDAPVAELSGNNNIAYADVVEMAVPLKDFNYPENISVYMWTHPDNQPEEVDKDETDGFFEVVNIK